MNFRVGNLSKRQKITIASIVGILLITFAIIIALKINQKVDEPQDEVITKVDIQNDNASLTENFNMHKIYPVNRILLKEKFMLNRSLVRNYR